jgi:hypothetical protein
LFAPLAAAALALDLLWLRVQARHWRYRVYVHERMRAAVPEYGRTVAGYAAPGRPDGLSLARPLALAVPVRFAATWVAVFAWVLVRARG